MTGTQYAASRVDVRVRTVGRPHALTYRRLVTILATCENQRPSVIDREFEFYEFFSFLKFNEFYEFFFG